MSKGDLHWLPKLTWWAGAAPPTQVTLSAVSWVGAVFEVTSDTFLWGGSLYLPGGFAAQPIFALWEWTGGPSVLRVWSNKQLYTPGSNSWQNSWCNRKVALSAGTSYAIAAMAQHSYFRHNNQLTTPVTNNGIQMYNNFQSTNIAPWVSTPSGSTNANGVDVLVQTR
jgi:hypothetical protein